MYDIIIGRDAADKEKFGDRGLIFIGKGYVKMGQYTSLSNRILNGCCKFSCCISCRKKRKRKSYTH